MLATRLFASVLQEQALPLGPRGSVKRWVLVGERIEERADGWTGYAGTGGRLTIVSGQEGGHRGPGSLRERQTAERRRQPTMKREKERRPLQFRVRSMRAMQFPAGPSVRLSLRSSVCAVVHATYAIVPPLFFAYESEHSRDQDGI